MWKLNNRGYLENVVGKLQHREVYERVHGRIPLGWVIHHIDQIKINNQISNLIALPNKFHTKLHVKMRECGIDYPREFIQELLNIYLKSSKEVHRSKRSSRNQKRKRDKLTVYAHMLHEKLDDELRLALERDS